MKYKVFPIVAALLATTTASAAVINKNSDGNISINGSLGLDFKNTEVQVQILGPFDEKKTLEEAVFDGGNRAEFMANTYINTVKCDELGNYSFVYNVKEENKFYCVSVNEPESARVQTVSVYAASSESEEAFLTNVNSADSVEMLEILKNEDYADILIGNRSDFGKITDEELLKSLADGLSKKNYESFVDFENELTELCAVILSGTMSDVEEMRTLAEEKLDLTKSELYEMYKEFSDEVKDAVFGRMINGGYTEFDEYILAFEEGVFLEKVKGEKYSSNMTSLIESNKKRFDFDLDGYSEYSDKVNKKLCGKDFDDMDDFKKSLADEIEDEENSKSPSSGGGGGGGSSSKPAQNIIMAQGDSVKTEQSQSIGFFDDIGNVSWAVEAINALAEKGVVSGKSSRQFAPMDNIKREEFVKMVVNAFGLTAADGEISFEDVSADAWYYNDIKTAYSLGIINGADEAHFGTGSLITRQDMAAILYRTAEKLGKEFGKDNEVFEDDSKIADYAKNAVYSLKYEGIISGMGDGIFAPLENATRAQAAKMIYLMMNK